MAVPFVVLGYKVFNHLTEKHWDKIPDRVLHIHDPQKREKHHREKQERKQQEYDTASHQSHLDLSENDNNSCLEPQDHMYGSRHNENSGATFNDDVLDNMDKLQYPDARNPAFLNNDHYDYEQSKNQPHAEHGIRENSTKQRSTRRARNASPYIPTPRRHPQFLHSDTDVFSEEERIRRKRKSSRPKMRSRSSHQGDRYYPSMDDRSTTVTQYEDRDRSNRDRHDKRQRYEAQIADKFSGTDLGLGALALGGLTGGYVGYKAGDSVNGKKRGGVTPLVLGVLGAIAGASGLNAAERGYEKQKEMKSRRSLEEMRNKRLISDNHRRSNIRMKKSYGRSRTHDTSSSSEELDESYTGYGQQSRRGGTRDLRTNDAEAHRVRQRKRSDVERRAEDNTCNKSCSRYSKDAGNDMYIRRMRRPATTLEPRSRANDGFVDISGPQHDISSDASIRSPPHEMRARATKPRAVHATRLPVTARNLQTNDENHWRANESKNMDHEKIVGTRNVGNSTNNTMPTRQHVMDQDRVKMHERRSSSLSSISTEDSWGEDEKSKRERRTHQYPPV